MHRSAFKKRFLTTICLIILVGLLSCAGLPPKAEKVPPFNGFMGAKWGISVEETKKLIGSEGKKLFLNGTERPPYALYASGTYLDSPVIFSYFFTPKSKRLYRVDVTLKDLSLYQKGKKDLIEKLGSPSYSQPAVDHWSYADKSLVIFQKEPDCIQISYSGGEILLLNHQEGGEYDQKRAP